jgi:hypothetical protein
VKVTPEFTFPQLYVHNSIFILVPLCHSFRILAKFLLLLKILSGGANRLFRSEKLSETHVELISRASPLEMGV